MTILTPEQWAEVSGRYAAGESVYRLSRSLGLPEQTLRGQMRARGLLTRGKRKYQFNEEFFTAVHSEAQAYWLGFIYAEGNLHRSTLGIKLANVDRDHLVAFRLAVQAQQPIKPVKNKAASVIRLSSVSLVGKLNALGVWPNKSAALVFPILPRSLQMHFVRGFFDGDGWVTAAYPHDMTIPTWQIAMCSRARVFLETAQETINRAAGITTAGSLFKKTYYTLLGEQRTAWTLSYTGNRNVVAVRDAIYRDATCCLTRKQIIAANVRCA